MKKLKLKLSGYTVYMYEVNSSNVASVGYDRENELLYVEFMDGSVYRYENVGEDMWLLLNMVNSKGSWLHWNVFINEDVYPYDDVTGEVDIEYTGMTTTNPGEPHPGGYMTGF